MEMCFFFRDHFKLLEVFRGHCPVLPRPAQRCCGNLVVCVHQRWVAAQRLAPLLHKSEPGGQMFSEEATKLLVYWAQGTGRGARGLHVCPLLLDINIDQMSGSFGKNFKILN